MKSSGSVHRVPKKESIEKYLAGYVCGIMYQGVEWLLTKDGSQSGRAWVAKI